MDWHERKWSDDYSSLDHSLELEWDGYEIDESNEEYVLGYDNDDDTSVSFVVNQWDIDELINELNSGPGCRFFKPVSWKCYSRY